MFQQCCSTIRNPHMLTRGTRPLLHAVGAEVVFGLLIIEACLAIKDQYLHGTENPDPARIDRIQELGSGPILENLRCLPPYASVGEMEKGVFGAGEGDEQDIALDLVLVPDDYASAGHGVWARSTPCPAYTRVSTVSRTSSKTFCGTPAAFRVRCMLVVPACHHLR